MFERFRQWFQKRALMEPRELQYYRLSGPTSTAGMTVTPESSLTSAAVFACIRVLAESISMLPLLMYERKGGGKQRVENHPLYWLLKEQPNPEMTAFELRETVMGHLCGWGNGYMEIQWSDAGQPVALWPLLPNVTVPQRVNGALVYDTQVPGVGTFRLPAWRVSHVRSLGGTGLMGYSPIRLHAESVGLALATQEFGNRYFGNGAKPGVVLKHPGKLTVEAKARLRTSWTAAHEGLSNAHRVAILEEGMGIESIGIAPNEAQFLETRKFQTTEIARIFRVPPHMIADLSQATFSNIEHQSIDFVVHTLGPWLVRWEQALSRDLLVGKEKQTHVIEFLVDGLLRGDISSRYTAYSIGRQNGWLSANDVRRMENMNPIKGGDVYLTPLNMVPAGGERGVSWETETPPQPSPDRGGGAVRADEDGDDEQEKLRKSKVALAQAYLPLFRDVAGRVVRREVADVRRAINKHLRKRSALDFRTWLTEFYRDLHPVVVDNFRALMESYAAQVKGAVAGELDIDEADRADGIDDFITRYLENIAFEYVASSQGQIEALMDEASQAGEDAGDAIETRLDEWEEKRPSKLAQQQTFEANNALAIFFYSAAGVTLLRWAASGKSCKFCTGLNGKVVGIDDHFVQAGATLDGGDEGTMKVRRNHRHGPIHQGCDCTVLAVKS
jgi:HK97 family phage portal protein